MVKRIQLSTLTHIHLLTHPLTHTATDKHNTTHTQNRQTYEGSRKQKNNTYGNDNALRNANGITGDPPSMQQDNKRI